MERNTPKKIAAPDTGSGCCQARRDAMKAALAVTALFGGTVRSAHANEAADLPPQPGDRLVRMDDEGAPQPLKTADIPLASKPVRPWAS